MPTLESCVSATCDYRVELLDYVDGKMEVAPNTCPKCGSLIVSFCPACRGMMQRTRLSREHPVCPVCKANVRRMLVRQRVRLASFQKASENTDAQSASTDDDGTTPLSPRESAVMTLLAAGRSNKEVATALAISVKTVETYRARIMLKLNMHSIVEIVHYAIANRLIPLPQFSYSKSPTQSADLSAHVSLQ